MPILQNLIGKGRPWGSPFPAVYRAGGESGTIPEPRHSRSVPKPGTRPNLGKWPGHRGATEPFVHCVETRDLSFCRARGRESQKSH